MRILLLAFTTITLPVCMSSNALSAQDQRAVTAADMPRIPHTASKEAIKTFQVAEGFSLELVAAEPLVSDPVAACFDASGRMFVAEMHGYPFSQEPTQLNPQGGGLPDAGIIRMLEDTDGDGAMDRSTVFADKISWPTSVLPYNGGIYVIAPKFLYYFKDTDGDNKADVREVVLEGFGRNNVQSVTNGLIWGLDNKIYFAAGRNPKDLRHRGKPLFSVSGADLRFDPRTEQFEIVTGGLQFGHSRDAWGVRFVCSNSNHIQQVVYPQHYLARNPFMVSSGLVRGIASDGASARVFRASPPEPWRIVRQKWRALEKGYRLVVNDNGGWEFIPLDPSRPVGVVPTEYPVGYFTSATGITIYRGDAYPTEYRGNAFVGDVGGNLVHRKEVSSQGILYASKRADQDIEFIRSSDNWFRPVNFVNAPDGTLYVLDMYRETVEHPYSIPAEIKKFLHMTSGRDRGRIYRIAHENMVTRKTLDLNGLSCAGLVAQLESPNGWIRDTAQRLLVERDDRTVVSELAKLLENSASPFGRLHALYTLDALDALTRTNVITGLVDRHPRVRAHAVRLSEPLLGANPVIVDRLVELTHDANQHVRYQVAYSLGEVDSPQSLSGLVTLARDDRSTAEIRTALLSSIGSRADQFLTELLDSTDKQSGFSTIVMQTAVIIGSHPSDTQTLNVLKSLKLVSPGTLPILLTGLGEGLDRRGSSLKAVITSQDTSTEIRQQLSLLFAQATTVSEDETENMKKRLTATQLLGFSHLDKADQVLAGLLIPQIPQSLQLTAVQSLAKQQPSNLVELLLSNWSSYSPQIRRSIIDALVKTPAHLREILVAVDTGRIKRGEIERDKKQLMLNHPDKSVQKFSAKLFGEHVTTDRAKVVQRFQHVLELDGNIIRGKEVFRRKCAVCHQAGTLGTSVAPTLVSVRNKSAADLLIAILDPNREAQPNFNVYSVVTQRGQILTGIIATEAANNVTLRRAEGKQDVILRSNIDEMISMGVSLMPEGLEEDLSARDLADVISFIKQSKEIK